MERTQSILRNQFNLIGSVGQAVAGQVLRRARPTSNQAPSPVDTQTESTGNGELAIRRAQTQAARVMQAAGNGQAREERAAEHRASVAEERAEAELLAIPDYESLSAAQVNARLGALTPDELHAVKLYEESHRGRRTILARVETLLAETGAG